jgi:hypothetical protein
LADDNLVTLRHIDVPFWRTLMTLVKWRSHPGGDHPHDYRAIIAELIGAIVGGILAMLAAGAGALSARPRLKA